MHYASSTELLTPVRALPQQIVAQEGGSLIGGLLPFIVILAAMYFLLIRPQQKRAKAQRELVASLGVGDRIVTLGGIHGTVESLDDDTIRLEIAPSATITVARASVGRRLVSPHAEADDEG